MTQETLENLDIRKFGELNRKIETETKKIRDTTDNYSKSWLCIRLYIDLANFKNSVLKRKPHYKPLIEFLYEKTQTQLKEGYRS